LAQLHDRIPLAMSPDTGQHWLNSGRLTAAEAEALVERIRAESFGVVADWEVYPVGRAVGSVRSEGPQLMEPITPPGTSGGLPQLWPDVRRGPSYSAARGSSPSSSELSLLSERGAPACLC